MTGKILNGRYEVHNEVGSGGMAIIYTAKDLATDWEVAVKVLRKEFSGDEEFVLRFKREAQAVANLDHPSIVRVYDVGQDEGVHYIVMEFVHGITLKEHIRKNRTISVEDSMRICLDICGALKNAHDNGVIHRDVKPHNVLISPDGAVKITDFGIAKFADTVSSNLPSGNVMGSVHYISPEQARGEETDEQADIYSLGVTLYEMLTGRLPYEGESTVEVARKHLNEALVPPEEINSKIPHSLSQVVVKAMSKDKKIRYKSCGEFARDLMRSYSDPNGNFVELPSYQAKARPHKQQPAESERQHPAPETNTRSRIIIVAGILLILLSAVLVLVLLNRPRQEEPATEMVSVPTVAGMNVADAERTISSSKLTPKVETSYSETIPQGEVMHQSPAAGTLAEIHSSVRIMVSDGPEPIQVPSLYGKTEEEAEQELMNAGLKLGDITYSTQENVNEGVVIRQDPEPDTELMPGDSVSIVLNQALQPSTNTQRMPDVVYRLTEEAVRDIYAAGFQYCVVHEEAADETLEPGWVTNQKQTFDAEVDISSLIEIYATERSDKIYSYYAAVSFDAPSGLDFVIALEDNGIYYAILTGTTGDEGTIVKEMYEVYTQTEVAGDILVFVNGQIASPNSVVVTPQ